MQCGVFFVFVFSFFYFCFGLNKRCHNCLYYRIPYFIDICHFFKTVGQFFQIIVPNKYRSNRRRLGPSRLQTKDLLFPSSIISYSLKYHFAYKPLFLTGCCANET